MAIEIGETAPEFTTVDQFGQEVTLSDFRGRTAVALVFFPLAFSHTCHGELCELRDNIEIFQAQGVQLLGISGRLQALRSGHGPRRSDFGFPLLSDFWPHGAIATGIRCVPRGPWFRQPCHVPHRRGTASCVRASSRRRVPRARSTTIARPSPRSPERAAQASTLTARAMTSARTTKHPNACSPLSSLKRGESGMASVALYAMPFESEVYR